MNPKNHEQRLATLLSQEQDLANELLTLSQLERTCCESDHTDRLVEIVAQRKEVMSTWEMHHHETLAAAQCFKIDDSPAKTDLRNAVNRLNDIIAAIQAEDQLSLQKLVQKTNQDLGRAQNMNQGSRWLQSLNPTVQPIAYDARQ